MSEILLGVFLSGFLGSLHCVAMCGGLANAASLEGPEFSWKNHILYQLFRGISYTGLGALAGFLGQEFNEFFTLLGIERIASLVTALLLFFAAFQVWRGRKLQASDSEGSLFPIKKISQAKGKKRSALLGFCTGLLPCGFLYAYISIALGVASPVSSALVLFVFWLSTIPALISAAGLGKIFLALLGDKVPLVQALIFLVAGLFSLYLHFQPMDHSSHHSGTSPSKINQTPNIMASITANDSNVNLE